VYGKIHEKMSGGSGRNIGCLLAGRYLIEREKDQAAL
jgi:hypothetical protein